VKLYEDEAPSAEVFDELRTLPFLGMEGRRAVILLKGKEFLKTYKDAFESYLENPSSSGTLILLVRKKKLDGRRKTTKLIDKIGAIVQCDRVRWNEAERWIRDEAGRLGCRMARGAGSALLESTGPNLLALESELEKLSAYVGEGGQIDTEAVEAVVAHGRERSIFDLADAVAARDVGTAIRLCEEMLLRGERREMIIGMLARQVRDLWGVYRLRGEGLRENEMGRRLGKPGWLVRKMAQKVSGLSDEWFAEQFRILAEADVESKTRSLRAAEESVWLEHVLARLCQA
jgi:DNA polymerase-3 subunit delta